MHLHSFSIVSYRLAKFDIPILFPNDVQEMQIQPPGAKLPYSSMPIRALEVCAPPFVFGLNVPTPTSLVGDQWPVVRVCDALSESCIVLDGLKPVADRERRSSELAEGLREVVLCLLGEDEVGRCWLRHGSGGVNREKN